jgi:hypothetical protein
MLPFLQATFQTFVFAHLPTIDYELVERYDPDLVVSVMNERFLVIVPNDEKGKSQRELEQEKLAAGLVR